MSGLVGRMCRGWPWLLAVLSGLLLVLCYAPFGFGNLSWVALAPLIAGVWFSETAGRREILRLGGLGFVFGMFYFGGSLAWLATLTIPGWILLSLYLALYPALWTAFLGTFIRPTGLSRRGEPVWMGSWHNLRVAFLGAAACVALEWVRGVFLSGFGWDGLGIALARNVALIQITDVTGVGGLSFLIVFANLIAVVTVRRLIEEFRRGARRPHYDFAVTVGVVTLAWLYGLRQMMAPAPASVPLTFAAVQANVPQATRNDPAFEDEVMERYRKHTNAAMALKPDLLLWPESATPRPIFNDQGTWEMVRELADGFPGDMLLGTVHYDERGGYNSAALLSGRGEAAQMHHKMHLVPFGEFVPFRQGFPFFAWVVGDLVPDDFDAGSYPEVLEMAARPVKIGALICFEDTLGDLAREFVLRGAQIFAVVTNDGWFLRSAGSRQHLDNAVFRCAENKIPMIRAANTGVTCLVDRFGVVRQELRSPEGSTFIEGVLFGRAEVPANPAPTFYARHGEVFSIGCILVAVATMAAGWIGLRKKKDSACSRPGETKISGG